MQPKEIKALRLMLDLSQEAFAARVGVSYMTIHRWESGKSKPYRLAEESLQRLATDTTKKGGKK